MFFTKSFIVMDLVDVHPRALNGEEEKRAVDLVLKITPLSMELARQLGGHVADVLQGGRFKSVTFDGADEPQRMKFGPKDLARPEIELKRVDIEEVTLKPQTDGAGHVCTVRATYEFPSPEELTKLTAGLGRKHFISCEDEDPALFPATDETEKSKKAGARARYHRKKGIRLGSRNMVA
jgi:hypothetical protein